MLCLENDCRTFYCSRDLLQYASDEIKNDPEIISFAVNLSACQLKWASAQIKNNKEIVSKAI